MINQHRYRPTDYPTANQYANRKKYQHDRHRFADFFGDMRLYRLPIIAQSKQMDSTETYRQKYQNFYGQHVLIGGATFYSEKLWMDEQPVN